MAGKPNERQERCFLRSVNQLVAEYGSITISAGLSSIPDVVEAKKVRTRTVFGNESYADVAVTQEDGTELKFQLKNINTPSAGGGGTAGVESSLPGLGDLFLKKAHAFLIKNHKIKAGDVVPKLYMRLSPAQQLVLLRGTPQIGGPIDYILSGPMDLTTKAYKDNLVFYNSSLFEIEAYSKLVQLYMVYRRYTGDQMFDPKLYGNRMVPKIFGEGKQGSKTLTGGRLVLEETVPSGGLIIT